MKKGTIKPTQNINNVYDTLFLEKSKRLNIK